VIFSVFLSYAENKDVRFFQYPDIENGKIVFCYNNDIYVVDENGGFATRLTSHIGMETHPKFSPDGKMIAFTGQYFGGNNVFIIPVSGGDPVQLTFYNDPSTVVDWTPDGKNILFSSRRNSFSRFFTKFFLVGVDGKFPKEVPVDKGTMGMFSPDGKKLLFNRHSYSFWWWKRYKGSANLDLWIYDFDTKKFTQLTDYQGNDMWPMWGYDGYYFVSDRDGIANIYKYSPETKEITKITDMKNDGVSWPSIDSKGERIVFLNDGKIYKLDLRTKEVKEINIQLQADSHIDLVEYYTPKRFSYMFDLSPSGKRVVSSIRGEVISFPAKNGIIRNYTNSSGARDKLCTWSPDGKYIAFISDMDGEEELYIVDQLNKSKAKKLTNTGNFKYALLWSPDSKKIIYSTNDRKLYYYDLKLNKSILVDTSCVDRLTDFDWSPDSKWIVYIKPMKNYATNIYFYNLDDNKIRKLDLPEDFYDNPRFTKDGKGLIYFRAALYSPSVKFAYYMALQKSSTPFFKEELDEEVLDKGNKKDKKKDKKDSKKTVKPVKIDFKGIEDRIELIKKFSGKIDYLALTDKYYYFLKLKRGFWRSIFRSVSLYYYDVKHKKIKEVYKDVDNYVIAAKGEKLGVYSRGKIFLIDVGKTYVDKGGKGTEVSISDVKIKLDHKEEWHQIFDEAWRMVKYNFYDENYHGVNWDSIGKYYRKFLPYIKSRQELNILIQKMVGELNASHQGARGGDYYGNNYKKPHYNLGLLGATFEPDEKNGLYRIKHIYNGDASIRYRSPLDAYYHDIKEGDYLLAINGYKITTKDNPYYYMFLIGSKAKMTISYNSKPSEQGAKEIVIDPIVSEINLRYKEWVDKNTKLVDSLSNGQIGYMHLPDMVGNGLNIFKKKIKEYRYKQGIIIDVRYNGGGGIDPQLIDYLEKQKYMTTRERYGFLQERPEDGFYGKIVVLINEYSYSDAEVFPRAFQIRKLGKVIGVPTLGFVIAVTEHRMIDGGSVRKTFVGIWDNEGKMMESKGVQPDILVYNKPEEELKGIDSQLLKAIEVLKADIKKDPRKFDYPHEIEPR